jgi:hypothetical protein
VKGSTGPQPLRPHTRSNRPIHQSCSSEGGATAGELPFGTMWPIARSTPVFRQGQPRTNKRKCGIQPANQSLITDVFRSRPHLCTIHSRHPPASMAARGRSIARSALDWGHQSALARCRCHGRRPHGPQLEEVPPPIASPVDSGRRHNRRPHPATASEESRPGCGHGLVSLTDPSATSACPAVLKLLGAVTDSGDVVRAGLKR